MFENNIFFNRFFSLRPTRFLISGGTSAFANIVFLFVFHEWFDMWYLSASVLALSISVVINFFLQKFWVFFHLSKDKIILEFILFLCAALINVFLNAVFMYILVSKLSAHYLFAQAVVIGFLSFLNYFLYKKLFKIVDL